VRERYVFQKKVVVVTGAAGGIGRALCRRFAGGGAVVAALDVDGPGVQGLAAELRAAGTNACGYACDVTREEQCVAVMAQVVAACGGIDVLVNNAGITHRSAFADTQVAVLRRVMEVNYFGSVHCTKAALSSLAARRGLIVVISSVAGFAPLLGRTGYAASKHALHGLFNSLRTELLAAGVGVTIVCPSFTDTNIARRALDADGSLTRHPQSTLGKLARPEDVADAIYRAAARRRRLAVLSPVGKLARLVSTLWPAYYERRMAAQLQHELMR
jgi:NAD(P)-dependent dehydrogenase (short-subunit alcohol dehydrogenase family)